MKMGPSDEKCYACDRPFRMNSHGRVVFHPEVLTIDGQRQTVGHDCYRKVLAGGPDGYQPLLGGPRLYCETYASDATLRAAGIVLVRYPA